MKAVTIASWAKAFNQASLWGMLFATLSDVAISCRTQPFPAKALRYNLAG